MRDRERKFFARRFIPARSGNYPRLGIKKQEAVMFEEILAAFVLDGIRVGMAAYAGMLIIMVVGAWAALR